MDFQLINYLPRKRKIVSMHLPDLFYQNRPNTPTSWFDSYLCIELTRDPVPTYTFDKRLSDTGIESSIEGFRLYAVDSLLLI